MSRQKSDRTKIDASAVLALVLALFAVAHTWNYSTKCFGRDFYQFWVVSREIGKSDVRNIYSEPWRRATGERYWNIAHQPDASTHQVVASDEHRVLYSTATPLLYTFFRIWPDDYKRALMVQQIVLFLSGSLAIVLLCFMLSFSWTATLLTIAVMFGWGEAYLSDIFCANVNQLQLLAVAILLWLELLGSHPISDYCGGALLALMVMFKPNLAGLPLLLAMMWIADGQRDVLKRHAIAFAVAVAALVTVTSIEFGSGRIWLEWLGSVRQLESLCRLTDAGTYALSRLIGILVCSLLPPLALLAVFLTRRRAGCDRQPRRMTLVVALGCAVPVLATDIVWLHYYVLAMPLMLVLLRPGDNGFSLTARYMIAAILLPMLCSSQLTEQWLWLGDPVSVTRRMAGATLALFALAAFELWRVSKPAAAALSSQAIGEHAHATQEIW